MKRILLKIVKFRIKIKLNNNKKYKNFTNNPNMDD